MMKDPKEYIAGDSFVETIASYNAIGLQNKSNYEVILEGLKIYVELTGCTSATLFSVDPDTFDFYYRTSTALHLEHTLKKMFEQLVDAGAVAEALQSSDIFEWKLYDNDVPKNYCVIVPLIVPSGVIGIVVLTMPLSTIRKSFTANYCRLHTNNFALVIHSSAISHELEQIKESTEQKIALRTNDIVKSTRELKRILDSIHAGIIIVNKSSGLITDANLLAADMIGTSKENLIGNKVGEYFFFHTDKGSYSEIITDQEGLLRKKNGSLVPIIKTDAGVSLSGDDFIIESFIDISERKKAEDALQQAHFELERRVEERTSQLSKANIKLEEEIQVREKAEEDILKLYWAVAQSPVSILITDINGVIEYVNNRFIELTGYKFEEAVGSTPRILKSGHLTSEDYKSLWGTLLAEQEWKGEYQNKKKNGDLFWVSAFICPIRNKEGNVTHYLGILEDISDKKQILDELVIAKDRAEESDRMKSVLLANMSHEFRTPLIGILGFSQFLSEELQDADQAEMVKDIELSGKRLLNTLDGVLSLSELEATKSSMKIEYFDLAKGLRDCVDPFQAAAEKKNLELTLKIEDDPLFIQTDFKLLQKSLGHILDNAIKYTNSGSVRINANQKYDEGKQWVVIEVKDTGIGINPNDQKVIFEAFRQASEGYSRYYEGCGLGLTISNKLIELLNGKITVASELSTGSVFSIWLPVPVEIGKVEPVYS